MSKLERAWRAWAALSRHDKAQFLALFREARRQEREAVREEAAGGAHVVRRPMVSGLGGLTLTEADFEQLD